MAIIAARLRPSWTALVTTSAAVAGRLVGAIGRSIPGTVGPALVAFGVWDAWHPGGYMVAGGILWLLDRRVP